MEAFELVRLFVNKTVVSKGLRRGVFLLKLEMSPELGHFMSGYRSPRNTCPALLKNTYGRYF